MQMAPPGPRMVYGQVFTWLLNILILGFPPAVAKCENKDGQEQEGIRVMGT